MRGVREVLSLGCILGLSLSVSGGEFHVSASGSDEAAGALDAPWKTLGWGVRQLEPGDVLTVHAGVYNERVVPPQSGTPEAYITIRAAPGDLVVIDGSGLPVRDLMGLVDLSNRSFLRWEGFQLRNFVTHERGAVPVGILVQGASEGIEIVDNEISAIASYATVDGDLLGRDAHGIAVYGSAERPIRDLLIRGNTVRDLVLGSSEALVLNGNVVGFRVFDNAVYDCDNIGIDAIGFEGVAPSVSLDQAREGWIVGNRVHDLTSAGNPAYGADTSAGGIYIDGGRDIVIERNEVWRCDIGIEVASEHLGRVASGISVRSNLLRENLLAGLFIGGYNAGSTGDVEGCTIAHNTFFNNDTVATGDEYGQIHIQYRVRQSAFVGNILIQEKSKSGGFDPFIVQWNQTGEALAFDYNLFHGAGTPVWVLDDTWIEGWDGYVASPLSGIHEVWGDPQFVDAGNLEFGLREGSPARDRSDPSILDAGERDLRGHLRWTGAAPDRGALEAGSSPPGPVPLALTGAVPGVVVRAVFTEAGFYRLEVSDDLDAWQTMPGMDTVPLYAGSEWGRALTALKERLFLRLATE